MKRQYFSLLLKTFFEIGKFEILLISKFLKWFIIFPFYQVKKILKILSKLITPKRVIISTIVIAAVFGIKSGYSFYQAIPDPKNLDHLSSATVIYDRNQTLLFSQYGNSNYVPIQTEELPAFLLKTASSLDLPWEISKILFPMEDKSLAGRIKKMVIAYKINKNYNRSQIINIYLNALPYSNEAKGIEAASLQLFGRKTKYLNNHQLVYLLLLPTKDAGSRIKSTLDKMVLARIITRSEKDNILREDLDFRPNLAYKRAPHVVEYILSTLNKNYSNELLTKGVIVQSTIDIRLQNIIQGLLLEKGIQGAIIVIKQDKMEVLAMIGSLNYYNLDQEENGQLQLSSLFEKYLSSSGAKSIELISQMQTSKGITFFSRSKDEQNEKLYPKIANDKNLLVKSSNEFSIGVWVEEDKNQASLIMNEVIKKALPEYKAYYKI